MFNIFRLKPSIRATPKIGGMIGYHRLADWWLAELSNEERLRIKENFRPMDSSSVTLTEGTILSSSETAVAFLHTLAGWFAKSEGDRHIAQKLLRKAEALVTAETPTLDKHFLYQRMIEISYRDFDKPEGRQNTVSACQLQITLAPEAAKAFRKEDAGPLPLHRGFERMARILDLERRYEEAIHLCNGAACAGWAGEWQGLIQRYQKLRERAQAAAG